MDISTPSCSYCIWIRYCQNHCRIFPNFQLFAWFDTLDLNRLPCSNSKIYDDTVFAGRFRYQLTMLGIHLLIWLSRFSYAHIAYVIDTDKIIAAFSRIFYYLLDFDTVEFNRRRCSNSKMYDDMVFNYRFWYQLTMFEVCIFTGLSGLLDTHSAYEIAI